MGIKVIERDISENMVKQIIQFQLINNHYKLDRYPNILLNENGKPYVLSKDDLKDFPFSINTVPEGYSYTEGGFFSKKVSVVTKYNIGMEVSIKKPNDSELERHFDISQKEPVYININNILAPFVEYSGSFKGVWLYKDNLFEFKSSDKYSQDQIKLLIYDFYEKEQRKFARLKESFERDESFKIVKRIKIPEKVKVEVWRRDEGKCVECGSKKLLEYDHIIPISKGGSNTSRNIQLLCEKCNRSKSNKIK